MKTYWTTEHYPDAVPIDFYELVKAMAYQSNLHLKPERRLTKDAIEKYLKHYTQFSRNVDAYRFYNPNYNHTIEVGVRFSNEDSHYFSPLLKKEIAKKFKLDPLNQD